MSASSMSVAVSWAWWGEIGMFWVGRWVRRDCGGGWVGAWLW